ncbi:hypothetical protein V1508DRAFT_38581 [Lipomyces doorenjongii]|uniref:uncharacterized protein n=1 Tax=Lipomyces doorenjongii TaxID=383834 RepID=UPI0034CFDC5D
MSLQRPVPVPVPVRQTDERAPEDDDSRQNSVDYNPTGLASFVQLSRIESIAQTTYDRQSFSLPASRSQSLSLSLHLTTTFGSEQHDLSCMEEPSTPTSTFMALDISENLNRIVLELVGEAVKGPEYIDKMAKLNFVMLGQRIISIRKLTAEVTGKWVLTADVLTEVVHTLFNRWMWRNDQPYDDAYANVVHTVLAVCLMRDVCPWPEKMQRVAVYEKLADLETCYYLRNTSTVMIRELVIATRPHENVNFVRRIIDIAADKSQGFDHEALIRAISTSGIWDSWIEKLVVIEEALRTPTDRLIDFIINIISDLTGISSKPDRTHKMTDNRIRDITTDIVDGTKLSGTGRKDALIMGLLHCLRSSVSTAFSTTARGSLIKLSGVLLNRNIQANHAIALLDALDEPQKTDLTDIWPPPISEPDNMINPVGNDIPGRQRSPYELLQDAVRTRNNKVVSDLRQLVICPLLQDIGDDMVNISCGHYFSRKMIEPWLAQTTQCPLCRRVGVTIQGPALWVDGVLDVIEGIERSFSVSTVIKPKNEAKIVVGIYMSHAVTVVGVKYDFMRDVVLIKDWFSDAGFAIPSVVYVNDTADEIISWGGGQAPSESCRVRHIFSKPYSVTLISSFISALFAKIKSYLNSDVAPPLRQNINVKYIFCIPDQFCPGGNHESIFLRAMNSARWDSSTVEIVPETKCGAIFALDSNAGGIRRPNQVLHVLCWDYFGVSQRVYKLCPEDRFGIWEIGPEEADHEVLILAEIESRIEAAIDGGSDLKAGTAVENEDRFPRELVLDAVQRQLAGRVFDDDLFECIPVSRPGSPKWMLNSGAMYFYEDYVYGDLMRTYFHAKELTLSLDISVTSDDVVPRHGLGKSESPTESVLDASLSDIISDSEDHLTVSSSEVAICMNIAAMKSLEMMPRIMESTSPSDRLSLVVFGPCADDDALMRQLAEWLSSDRFAKRRPEYTITVGKKRPYGWSSITDKGIAYDSSHVTGKSSSQIAIDGLWIACKMVMAGEA